ncbi:type II secretion system F family protein [Nocardioides sp. WL0053]|uniref:Type II secretion system F family protein n=1 Tax=Nocardioides jiangsuensis TaxID=2866161 RepID=A0ABS7RP22_9ACTN|nr:type II secretion system F family protein [Nocardioides jiangsuensis]MBY9076496.1 type II secretion system F family protein [Nocardioides jiangsuensis]
MSLAAWGGLLGAGVGFGTILALSRVIVLRRPRLDTRVLPYVRDLPQLAVLPELQAGRAPGVLGGAFGPFLRSGADSLDRVLGGATSVRRRLERANLAMSVHDFRVEQVLWGLAAFAVAAALSLVVMLRSPGRAVPLLILCCVAFVLGALLRENRLTTQVRERERRILAEFPAIAELLALAVVAGEGPVSGLDRVVTRSHGELSADLSGVLAAIRTGTPVARALDEMAGRSGLPVVARFAEAMAVAVERGTPLTDVLHAQAADVREAGRRALIESGARKEVLMMVPVVFLVLPVTVLFAFWPGVVGLRLVTP